MGTNGTPHTTRHSNDLDLVRRFTESQPSAVDEMVRRLSCVMPMVVSLAHGSGTQLDDADRDDLVQDAIVCALRRLSTFQGRSKLETFVYRICFHELMNYRRRERRRVKTMRKYRRQVLPPAMPPESDPRLKEIKRSLLELPSPRGEIVRLRVFGGLSFGQIGEHLSTPKNTIRSQYYRSLRWLRAQFA